jgi:hypothetical protein
MDGGGETSDGGNGNTAAATMTPSIALLMAATV